MAAGAAETLAAAYRAPIGVHFNAQMAVLCALGARTLGAVALALYAWTWIRGAGLWTLVLPHGQDVMNIPYGVLALAGGWVGGRLRRCCLGVPFGIGCSPQSGGAVPGRYGCCAVSNENEHSLVLPPNKTNLGRPQAASSWRWSPTSGFRRRRSGPTS